MRKQIACFALIVLFTCLHGYAEEWGNLKGRVVFDGDAPTPAALNANKDQEVCGLEKLYDESIKVGEDNGLANVVVYVYVKRGSDPPPVHDSYQSSATAEVKLDNKACRFEPHVAVLQTSQTLLIGNSDSVGHNTKIDCVKNSSFNTIVAGNSEIKQQFSAQETAPVPVSCSIHNWMKAFVLIRESPYAAVTDENGTFEIKNLPAGEWTFQFWHEKAKYLDKVSVDGKETKWKKGRTKVTIAAGDNDMGTISVAAKEFK